MESKKINKKYLVNSTYIIIVCLFLILVALLAANFFIIYSVRAELRKASYTHKNNINISGQDNINNSALSGTFNSTEASTEPILGLDENGEHLFFSSFFDSFAADLLIDKTQTNLYRDNLATAVYFEPDYSWEPASDEQINRNQKKLSLIPNDFASASLMIDRRCLGESCLVQKGTKLYYNDKPLVLPSEIKESSLAAISIGTISSRWLIGLTVKEGSNFQGRVYFFDGYIFSPLIFPDKSETISSPYFGLFGFGGEDADYLIIYGAYKGIAYRFQNSEATDVSDFFDIRAMIGGFRPEIIKVKSDLYNNWYIYSSNLGRTQLIKLWSDSSNKIIGQAVFKNIFLLSDEAAEFTFLANNKNEVQLLARVRRAGQDHFQVFRDRGFKNEKPGVIVFNPVIYDSKVNIKQIADSNLGSKINPCFDGKLSFSYDNKNWQLTPSSQNLNNNFSPELIDKLFLRVDFPSQNNKFFSPFLGELSFDFYYQK